MFSLIAHLSLTLGRGILNWKKEKKPPSAEKKKSPYKSPEFSVTNLATIYRNNQVLHNYKTEDINLRLVFSCSFLLLLHARETLVGIFSL